MLSSGDKIQLLLVELHCIIATCSCTSNTPPLTLTEFAVF